MGKIKEPKKVLLIVGLIYVPEFNPEPVVGELEKNFGKVGLRSATIPFVHTAYYNKEMGQGLLRRWEVFENPFTPEILVDAKLRTNELEKKYLNEKGGRKINLDPGLLSLSNLILASTKNYSHRIYLGRGIYAEVTLLYRNGGFQVLEWTYPDYREKSTLEFFNKAREFLKKKPA
ncbi:MAG TPA: DUF4416 family protein [candidate division WOR-3 bacterium]|uniref:DUF4416 family protein n=1 Tax=candidate division WOR-3 bacterium TaxID=2052148 RepID=A0A9C9ELW5_UNCW3|nr:DUF4416 family protein [candidate division WOR-3 bacterium]